MTLWVNSFYFIILSVKINFKICETSDIEQFSLPKIVNVACFFLLP